MLFDIIDWSSSWEPDAWSFRAIRIRQILHVFGMQDLAYQSFKHIV